MRGVPGSGKSTLAKVLAGDTGVIHSTDIYRYVDDKYHFDPNDSHTLHNKNFEAFCQSLNGEIPVVICDNTNTRRQDFERYVSASKEAGYLVAIVALPHPLVEVATERTIHKVPAEAIQQMIDEWED